MAEIKDNPIINYVAQAAQQNASDTKAKLGIQVQLDEQEEASNEAMLAASIAGGSKATQIAAEESWKASSDVGVAAMQEALGTSWTAQGSESNKWAARIKENAEKAYSALDIIKEKQTKTLLNDPIGFIEAQFSLPADIATHNYYADKHNKAEDNLNRIISSSNAAAIAVKQMEKRTSNEFAEAKAQEAMALAAGNVAALKRQSAGDKIKGITEINNLTAKQTDLVFRVHALRNSDESLELQRQSQSDNHKLATVRLQQRQEELANKAATEEEWRVDMETRNIGAKAKGVPEIVSLAAFKREFTGPLSKNPIYQDMFAYGSAIQMNDGSLSGISVAQNAGSAARNYAATGGVNLANNPVGSFLSQVYSAQRIHPTAPKDPIAFAEVVNTAAINEASNMRRSIDNSNPNTPNIYAAPAAAVMIKTFGVMNDPFIVETVKPMLDLNPNTVITDATMLAKAADYAKTNRANFNMAAESISDYYKRAVVLNNSIKLYKENGLPAQTNYIARIDNKNIDLTDITQVRQYIFKKNMQGNMGFIVPGVPNTGDFASN